MEMSKAAIAPTQPVATEQQKKHPLYREYEKHLRFCRRQLITALGFDGWLHQYEQTLTFEEARQHPRYSEFQRWMRDNKAGARKCPAGVFPQNFNYWLEGGRW